MLKLNYLLVMPRIVNNLGDGYSFPLGLPYISKTMKKAGFNVYTLNLNHYAGNINHLLCDNIKRNGIDVVMTGGQSFQFWQLFDILKSVKEINRAIITIVGGGIITGDPETAMSALRFADIGVIGEGELTSVDLCETLERDGSLASVNGIIYPSGEERNVYHTSSPRSEISNIDDIPWPDYDGFELAKNLESSPSISGINQTRTLFMLASRSCPYNCSFCFHTVGKKYRQRSLDGFFAELEHNIEKYKINYLCVADELLSHNKSRLFEFCERIRKYNISWWAQFRVDGIDEDIIQAVKGSGCTIMSFGLESADNEVLKSMQKHTTVEQIEQTLSLVDKSGVSLEGAFIFGDEAETVASATNTLNWWERHRQYDINLNTITVFPGCGMYKNAVRDGIIENPVAYLKDGCPQINMTRMSDSEYTDVVNKIISYPVIMTDKLDRYRLVSFGGNGRINTSGICSVCGAKNCFSVKLFNTNFYRCSECGARFPVEIPQEIISNIGKNMSNLLGGYDNVGVWGINYNTFSLFRLIKEFTGDNVFPIDVSYVKQFLYLNGSKVNDPRVITRKGIECVIIAIPAIHNTVELQIKYMFPSVSKVLSISDMVSSDVYSYEAGRSTR
ncbi:MAG: cobalamin-dependent protein [Peptococcaceae bacterium]|jgi:radical SAM superfamily enzyme YgiQ (UPF0313 family)|nr:cobalamin-dependent protein [Peptococcaceae bacterium]